MTLKYGSNLDYFVCYFFRKDESLLVRSFFKEVCLWSRLLLPFFAVFGAVLPYLLQRNKELNLKIADQKREAYASFLTNFTKISVAAAYDENEKLSGQEADLERLLARDKLLLYASDDVIKAYDAWVRYSDSEEHYSDKEGELVNLIFLAIRKDLLGKSKVTKNDLENLNPFLRG